MARGWPICIDRPGIHCIAGLGCRYILEEGTTFIMVLCLIILRRKAKSGHILVGKIKSKIYVMSFLLFAVPFLSVLFDVQESTF